MNTSAVSKLLGVSSSTVQRWVKHIGVEMEKNEFGHYLYSDEAIEALKNYKEQVQSRDAASPKKTVRKATVSVKENGDDQKILEQLKQLEEKLENKADSVVAYQLLQHRGEIEELQKEIQDLRSQVEKLERSLAEMNEMLASAQRLKSSEKRKKGILKSIFGF